MSVDTYTPLSLFFEFVSKPYFIPTLLLTFMFILYFLHKRKWSSLSKYKTNQLPPFDRGLPFVGHAIGFGNHPLQYAEQKFERYGPVFTLEVLGKRLTFLIGPQVFKIFHPYLQFKDFFFLFLYFKN
jgi:hypothetical protein